MRILIAYAFPEDREARTLQKLLSQYLVGPYKAFLTHVALAVRRHNELHDFLFDPTTEFTNPGSERSFDALDMVVVLGDPNLLPWAPAARQLYYLVKQCLRASKPAFLSGCGMQLLAFLCSMGADRPRISRTFRRAGTGPPDPEMEEAVDEGELVVDGSNGDLYQLEELPAVDPRAAQLPKAWRKYKNVGLHFVHGAEGQLAGQTKRLGAQARKSTPMRIGSGRSSIALRSETTVHCAKRFVQHWLLRDLPRVFQVAAHHLWEVHEPPAAPLEMIGSSDRGPQIMQLGLIVGVQFLVTPRFPETCTLFRSWVLQVVESTRHGDVGVLPDVLGLEVIRSAPGQRERARSAGPRMSATLRGTMPSVRPESGTPPDGFVRAPALLEDAVLAPATEQEDERLPLQFQQFAKHEVRRMLHPTLVDSDKNLVTAEAPIRKVVRVAAPRTRPYCRWREFSAKEAERDAVAVGHLGGNFVAATPSIPHVLHDFRPVHRDRWVGGNFTPYGGDGWQHRASSRTQKRPATAYR